ncbi:TolB family protein [Kitasatospora sp. NPDC048365]|uniref:TolB family protein n=1 Tax=Kitasatospora sp. NPDC048365 TaxID=3364050 RepID=UPI0037215E89
MTALSSRGRVLVVLVATVLLAGVAVGYVRWSAQSAKGAPVPVGEMATGARLQVLSNGRLSTLARSDPGGPRSVGALECDRAYAAADTVVCLTPVGVLGTTRMVVLDAGLHERRSVPLAGFPNRTRVSASGRMVAWTLFVGGHSYAAGGFATQTGILDTRTGGLVESLEGFAVVRDGRPYRAADLNFWGVTFARDDNRFYATMSTDGRRYLVEGDLAARTVRTVAENVECPSLSPDGTRIAFKQAVDGDPAKGWRLSVLDLASMRVTNSAERRSVDDQAAWLDGGTLGYALQRSDGVNDIWAVSADGGGEPRLLVPEANSPAAVD